MKPRFKMSVMSCHPQTGQKRFLLTPLNNEAERMWMAGNFGLVIYQP